jgi:hypothetical protein
MIATELITKNYFTSPKHQAGASSLILAMSTLALDWWQKTNVAFSSNLLKNDHENKKSLASFH